MPPVAFASNSGRGLLTTIAIGPGVRYVVLCDSLSARWRRASRRPGRNCRFYRETAACSRAASGRLIEEQGHCHFPPLLRQDVVGPTGGGGVHGFDPDAARRQGGEPSRLGEADARAAAENHYFHLQRRDLVEM